MHPLIFSFRNQFHPKTLSSTEKILFFLFQAQDVRNLYVFYQVC